jgi:hypothetical protein
MRFDQATTFIGPDGMPLTDTAQENREESMNPPRWTQLLECFQAVAATARGDWQQTYVVVAPECGDPLAGRCKAALARAIQSTNFLPPASWHTEISRENRIVLPLMDRVLVLGTGSELEAALPQLKTENPRTMLCGLHDLPVNQSWIGYRDLSDVPLNRLLLCLRSMFTSLILLNDKTSGHRLVDVAKRHGIPVVCKNSVRGLACTH